MKVLVVGQGGREHVLTWKLAQSPNVSEVFCAPGNAGTALDVTNVDIPTDDIQRLVRFARIEKIGLTVIGPEVPLAAGIVDAFQKEGLTVFGPNKLAAQLEGSKVFSKEMMRHANVPTADYVVFNEAQEAIDYIADREEMNFVVKADGLAAGKGVEVCRTKLAAKQAVQQMMIQNVFGDAGKKVIIEELLEGEEASILAIVDDDTIVALESSQDHKPALDGDEGPNTGGMGAYSPAPIVTPELMDTVIEKILIPIVHTMKKRGCRFRGVLYAGIMVTSQGPKALEFNVRFGDPEAQPVLMRLKTDLAELLLAAAEGRLSEFPDLEWDSRPAVCVVMASNGYPGDYRKGHIIRGLDEAAKLEHVKVFHAGTTRKDGEVVTNGGRVLGVTAVGDNISEAKLRAYQAVKEIRWNGAWCRKDISDKARG
jgi:phosphoribosylamine---glycine ligase